MPIFLDPLELRRQPLFVIPRIKNADGSVQHVYCEGARFHVVSWSTSGQHCSEPECEINAERKRRTSSNG